MVPVLILLLFALLASIVLNIACSNDGFGSTITLAGVVLTTVFLSVLTYEYYCKHNLIEYNTEIINRYKAKEYSLELKVDGDKVDTLYIFK